MTQKERKFRTYGLCEGRHLIPVEEYIFPAEVNPIDFDGMLETAREAVKGAEDVQVYVTGLTAAMLAVVSACAEAGIPLMAYHFDRSTGEYRPQSIIPRWDHCGNCGFAWDHHYDGTKHFYTDGGDCCPNCHTH